VKDSSYCRLSRWKGRDCTAVVLYPRDGAHVGVFELVVEGWVWHCVGRISAIFLSISPLLLFRASSDSGLSRWKRSYCVAVVLYPRDAKNVVVLGVIETGKIIVSCCDLFSAKFWSILPLLLVGASSDSLIIMW
jgi:ferredoxin-fold anticodon binding domain-containing protein